MLRTHWWHCATALLLAASPLSAQRGVVPEAPRLTLRAGRLAGAIHLDGLLSEPAWASADSIADLTQVEPVQGGAPSGRTVVKVLADAGTLVIGIVAYDPEPAGIVSQSRAPDSELENEDHIRVVLDPFRDGRSGYVFAVNPGGARVDALVAREGEDMNTDWDAVWEAGTARLPAPRLLSAPGSPAGPAPQGGWSAEIRIPLRSLAFRPGLDAWGFNVERRIQRRLETDRWANPLRDYGIAMVSRAGLLTDLPAFELGAGLSIRPAFTGGIDVPGPGEAATGTSHPSLDVGQRIGSNLLASLTVNTDFAETDVDTRQANLTRFPLFFPEKRTFFLEGADIFDFGLGLDGETMLPFFSRRIGLVEGQQVPITAGAKLNGRVGDTGIGALVVRTGEADLGDGVPGATRRVAPAGMGVVRLRRSVLAESSAGILATFGDPLGRAGAWTAGADATFHTTHLAGDKNFLVGAWGLATGRNGLAGDVVARSAVGFKVDYPNDLLDLALTYRRVGESFDPSLGFVPRSGIHATELSLSFSPRPGGFIRQLFFENHLNVVTDLRGRWESYGAWISPLSFQTESGEHVELGIEPQGERLPEPFEVSDGVVIPAGAYHFPRYGGEVGLASRRALSASAEYWFGQFYDGRMQDIQASIAWRPSAVVNLSLELERAIGQMPEGDFRADVLGATAALNPSPDLQLKSFVQYDNESRTIGANTRLRWTFSPYGTVFVVYNHNLQRTPLDRWGLESSQLLVKAQYTLRY